MKFSVRAKRTKVAKDAKVKLFAAFANVARNPVSGAP